MRHCVPSPAARGTTWCWRRERTIRSFVNSSSCGSPAPGSNVHGRLGFVPPPEVRFVFPRPPGLFVHARLGSPRVRACRRVPGSFPRFASGRTGRATVAESAVICRHASARLRVRTCAATNRSCSFAAAAWISRVRVCRSPARRSTVGAIAQHAQGLQGVADVLVDAAAVADEGGELPDRRLGGQTLLARGGERFAALAGCGCGPSCERVAGKAVSGKGGIHQLVARSSCTVKEYEPITAGRRRLRH